jgi:hypothetical protein
MRFIVVGVLAVLTGVGSVAAQSQPSADERAVLALEERERLAVLAEDTTALHCDVAIVMGGETVVTRVASGGSRHRSSAASATPGAGPARAGG